jgi:hypothetical protein
MLIFLKICWKSKTIEFTITNAQHKIHFCIIINPQLVKIKKTKFEIAEPHFLK